MSEEDLQSQIESIQKNLAESWAKKAQEQINKEMALKEDVEAYVGPLDIPTEIKEAAVKIIVSGVADNEEDSPEVKAAAEGIANAIKPVTPFADKTKKEKAAKLAKVIKKKTIETKPLMGKPSGPPSFEEVQAWKQKLEEVRSEKAEPPELQDSKLTIMLPEVPQEFSDAEAGHFREQILIQTNTNIAWSFIIAGKMLYEISKSGWIQKLGETMGSFLASRKVSFGPAVATKLLKIYEILVLKNHVTADQIADIGDYEKAYIASVLLQEGKMTADEVMSHAKANSRADLIKLKQEKEGKPDIPENWKFNNRQWKILVGLLGFLIEDRQGVLKVLRKFNGHAQDSIPDLKVLLMESRKHIQ